MRIAIGPNYSAANEDEDKGYTEWYLSPGGLYHWYRYCGDIYIPTSEPYFGTSMNSSWIKTIDSVCPRCNKQIPPGLELAMRMRIEYNELWV